VRTINSILAFLCIGVMLVGCSGNPDVGDIEPQLTEGWQMCKGLKMTDLRKTNGIAHGAEYEMAITYKLEITKDATAEEAWIKEGICPQEMQRLFQLYGMRDQKFPNALKVGDIVNVSDTFTMIKSEKGWITK